MSTRNMATKKKQSKFPFKGSTDPNNFEVDQTSSPMPKAKQVKAAKPSKGTLKRISKKYPGRKKRISVPSDY